MMKNKNYGLIILIILASILFFFKLGSFSLYDAAETTYGEFIKQMRLTGDWMTMHYNGKIIFDKPPLYYWIATLFTYIFGFTEWAIRLPAAICGVLTVVVTYLLGKTFYNQKVGFYSGIVVMTAFQFMIQSRIAEIDIMLTLLLASSILFFWQGYKYDNKNYYLLSYLMMALGVVLKGIIGAAIPGFTIFLFLLFKGELKRIFKIKPILGSLIILAIGFPWYIIETIKHGEKFIDFALSFLFMARFKGVVAGHPGPWYYYILAIILGFAPWSHFLPYSFIRTWKKRLSDPELLSLSFIIPVFIIFSIAKTKLPSYLLPIYPFLAIMVGKLWIDFFGEEQESMRKGMTVANIFLAIVTGLIIIGFSILGTSNYSGQYQELMPQLLFLAGTLAAGSILSIFFYFIRKYKTSFTLLPITGFAIALILTTQILPAVEKYKGSKELGEKVTQVIKENEQIAAYRIGNRPSVVTYNAKPIIFIDTEVEAKRFLNNKKGYLFTNTGEIKNFEKGFVVFDKIGELAVINKQ
jgi:4-amino-4-deoxy-L-arabinose transferase-like glycosyltransferase